MIPGVPKIYAIGAAVFVCFAALTGMYLKGRSDAHASYTQAILAQERKAQAAITAAVESARAKEHALMELNTKTEKANAAQLERINGLRIANGRLIAAAGGLFDRNGRPRHPDPGTAVAPTASSHPGGSAGCVLSDQVSVDLQSLAYDADRSAVYAQSCKAHVVELHSILQNACRP